MIKKPFRFILVDDDVFLLTLAEKLIRSLNHYTETITFSCAREALKFITNEYDGMKNKIPAVLLTDLHMPETDGFALLDGIEKMDNAVLGQLHVFVLSAGATSADMNKVLSYSCVTGFYNKPCSVEKIEQIIIKCVQCPD